MSNILLHIGKIGLVGIAVIVILLLILVLIRSIIANSLKRKHMISTPEGIDEEVVLNVGGIKQYLYIRGQNKNNPIILFLHGGPGGTMTSVLHVYQYHQESDYTVVNWDQRVSGKTYFLNQKGAEKLDVQLNINILLDDLHEIVMYLQQRFEKKVILMGHSWGTVLGSLYVIKHPETVQAFVGVGQTINLNEGILEMGALLRAKAEANDAVADVSRVDEYMSRVRQSSTIANSEAMELYKIGKKYMPVDLNTTIFLKGLLTSPYYSLRELSYYLKMGKLAGTLFKYLVNYDLRDFSFEYDIPIIYMLGERDWHTRIIAKSYFDKLKAPFKQFIIIEEAGHIPFLDQSERFAVELHNALNSAIGASIKEK